MTSCGFGLWMKMSEEKFAPVPLTAVSVKVSIINLVTEVQVEQSYTNKTSNPIKLVYKFPLTEGANMFEFSAEINGREISSKVKESVDEETDYDETIRREPSAFMMAEKLKNIFMVELGELATKSSATIRLKYVTKLEMEGEEFRFRLPWTVAPRYVPAKDESAVTDFWSKLFSKTHHTQAVPYELKFEADVWMTAGIKEIRSPTHNISMSHARSHVYETKRTVTLSDSTATMDGDLLLFVEVDNPYEGSLIIEESVKGSSALMLSILPKFKQLEQKAELIFVIDRFSSVHYAGIWQIKSALLLFLHSLRRDCYVNIVGCGSTHHLLFPEASRKYDAEVLKLATAMDANLGDWEVFESLQAIFKLPVVKGYARKVFVITADRVVSHKRDVISLIEQHSGKARVFALGLGCKASRSLVEGIARAGNGTALFTSLEAGLGGKVIDQLRDALRPSWTDIKVEWDGFGEEDLMGKKPLLRQAPSNGMIPSVFSGKHLMVYALVKDGAKIPQEATLTVQTPKKKVLSIKFHLEPKTADGSLIHRMAAKKLIQGLQERSNEASKKQIIKLASTYGLVSPFTSFVAVDRRNPDKTLKGSPIMMKSTDVPDCLSSAMLAMSLGRLESSSPEHVSTNTKKEEEKEPRGERKMMEVISLQQYYGSFKDQLDYGILSKILDSSWDEIIEAGKRANCPGIMDDKCRGKPHTELWTTLLAVSYLKLGLPQFRESWALVVEKANNWLSTQYIGSTHKLEWKEKADQFIKAKLDNL